MPLEIAVPVILFLCGVIQALVLYELKAMRKSMHDLRESLAPVATKTETHERLISLLLRKAGI